MKVVYNWLKEFVDVTASAEEIASRIALSGTNIGGVEKGVLGGVIGGLRTTADAPLAPKEAKPRAPVRVGGRVREPRLISRVEPKYPALARQTHIQGAVVIDAVLDESGNVVEMKVVSGHPLLLQAAVDAVKQWKYEPTYLNDVPVAVQLNITVTFRLSQ